MPMLPSTPAPAPPPEPPVPAAPPLPSPPAAPLSPWAWTTAVVLGQPTAHRVVRAFFFGLIGLASVLLGGVRDCR